MVTDFIWESLKEAIRVKDRVGFERFITSSDEVPAELVARSERRTVIKSTPDEEVVKKELFFDGFEIPYKAGNPHLDCRRISRFDPRNPEVRKYLEDLSRYLDGMAEFLVLHESFPEPYAKGLAWIVQMVEGNVSIIPLILVPEEVS